MFLNIIVCLLVVILLGLLVVFVVGFSLVLFVDVYEVIVLQLYEFFVYYLDLCFCGFGMQVCEWGCYEEVCNDFCNVVCYGDKLLQVVLVDMFWNG